MSNNYSSRFTFLFSGFLIFVPCDSSRNCRVQPGVLALSVRAYIKPIKSKSVMETNALFVLFDIDTGPHPLQRGAPGRGRGVLVDAPPQASWVVGRE